MILLTIEVENFTTLHSTSNLPRYIKLPPLVVSHTAETTHTVLSKHWDPTSKEQSWKIPTPPKFEPASPRIQACNQTTTVIFYSQGEKNLQSNAAAGGGRLLWASELVFYPPKTSPFSFLVVEPLCSNYFRMVVWSRPWCWWFGCKHIAILMMTSSYPLGIFTRCESKLLSHPQIVDRHLQIIRLWSRSPTTEQKSFMFCIVFAGR